MSSEIAGNREAQEIDESNSEFVCLQQDLPINPNKGFVKMDISIKNLIIDKLNHLTEAVFDESLSNEQKVALLKETHVLISTLNNLPVLVVSKATNDFVDCETNDAQSDVVALDGGDTRSSGQSDADKHLKQLDILLNKVGKFDAKQDDIRTWFSKYEFYSGMLGWTDEQRVATLSFFLSHELFRVVQHEEMNSFKEIKDRLFEFIDNLLSADQNIYDHINQMNIKFKEFKFSKPEQRYWINCIYEKEGVREFHEIVKKLEEYVYISIM